MILALLIAAGTIAGAPAGASSALVVPANVGNAASAANTLGRPVMQSHSCKSDNSADILVCGRPADRYRIDPAVLEAIRQREAAPAKPPLSPDTAPDTSCVGPQHCGDEVIPLVGMALVVAKAAALAANGDDWREALRTHEDEYRLYQQSEARKTEERRATFGISVRN